MTFEQLRLRHPKLIYKHFTIARENNAIVISYEFFLEPDLTFHSIITIPYPLTSEVSRWRNTTSEVEAFIAPYAFNLGLV